MARAADTLKKVFLELGGKSANVILDDADFASTVAMGSMTCMHAGQGCAITTRMLLPESRYDEGIEMLEAAFKAFPYGDPTDPANMMGPLINARQRERVLGYIEQGKKEGASLVAGGSAAQWNGKGHYVEATIFDGVTPEMTIAREEIFGPVLAVQTFDDFDQAVALGNQSMYGLAAGIWTKDIQKAHRTARAIKAGTVWINTYNFYDPAAPFGGYKLSGAGSKAGGPDYLLQFMDPVCVTENTLRRGFAPEPGDTVH